MPDVRLLKDHKGHKADEIVSLTDKQLAEAFDAGAVRKVYPQPVLNPAPTKKAAPAKTAEKTAAAKTAAASTPPSGE